MIRRRRMASCRHVRRLLDAFLDGEIPVDQVERVAAHLDVCEACGIEADVRRQVIASIGRLRPDLETEALAQARRGLDEVIASDV